MPNKVYLPQISIVKKGGVHTAYVGEGHSPVLKEGQHEATLYTLEFLGGVARNVDERLFERMQDAGVASLDRPRIRDPYDEED